MILDSLRSGTKKQCQTYVKKWLCYTAYNALDFANPSLQNVLYFWLSLHNSGSSYSAVGTARSALSSCISIDGHKLAEHPLIIRLITGIYSAKPLFLHLGYRGGTTIYSSS